jgi:predicted permease
MRHALRTLAASPAFTIVCVLTLALGIGANTAIFSLLDQALLRRLPVRDPGQLRTALVVSRGGEVNSNVPSEFFDELGRAPRAFAGVFAYMRTEMNADAGADVERVLVEYVSGRYCSTLGVPMLLGRAIGDADEAASARVAVLSHRFWIRRFGGDPSVIGRTLALNGIPATVVGVTASGFSGTDPGVSPDVRVPLPTKSPFANLWVTVRLNPSATGPQAQAEAQAALDRALDRMRPGLARYRESDREWYLTLRAAFGPADRGLGNAMETYLEPLRILFLLSIGVLLIACVNVANLLLARALARTHEFGVRLSLGAGRLRLIRHVLAESVALAALGCAAGIAVAFVVHRALVTLLMRDLSHRLVEFRLDPHVLGFAMSLAAVTVLIFGSVPAVRATRVDVCASLRNATARGRGRRPALAKGLVAAQVAIALVLLLGAGLLLGTLQALGAVDTGVALDRMLTMKIGLSARETQRIESPRIYADIVARAKSVPGVADAALGWDYALGSASAGKSIWVEGQPAERSQGSAFNVVGPRFFSAAGIPIVLGREFTDADTAGARKVVVVNETWVRRYAGGRNPIGMHLGDEGAVSVMKYEIVGVVRDSRTVRLRQPARPTLYQALMQDDWASNAVLHVRTREDPRLAGDRVRAAIRALNPHLPVYDITTLDDRRSEALGRDRMMAALSAGLGGVALLLTVIGIYGVIAYSIGRRTSEIGIRMALGATSWSVRWLVLRETLVLAAIGAMAGVPLALAVVRVLKSTLFGVEPQDPATLAYSLFVLIAAAALGGWLPAWRAARLEPSVALRRD